MDRSRDFRCTARVGGVAGLVLFAGLVLGAQPGTAAPVAPVGPTGIAVPTAPPLPPKPVPCAKNVKCVPPGLQPCLTIKPEECQPSTKTSEPPTSEPPPSEPSRPARPNDPPVGVPTPNRIDTGGSAADPVAEAAAVSGTGPTWLLWAVPAGALLILAAGLAGAALVRSEQDRRR